MDAMTIPDVWSGDRLGRAPAGLPAPRACRVLALTLDPG
jgi:hypothetical protein